MRMLIGIMLLTLLPLAAMADDPPRRLLVTFKNVDAQHQSAGFQPPYRARKRYAVSPSVRKNAKDIAAEHSLAEVEQWPLKSLSVYCYVFEIPANSTTDVVAALKNDKRVESVQWLNTFQTQSTKSLPYDDTYASMQHGLDTISLSSAHSISHGEGVRIVVVDSDADDEHEDLKGSIKRIDHLKHGDYERDQFHGTAVASIIAAKANNSLGIVGIAPAASLEVSEACWRAETPEQAVCDTFSLAKAFDAMFFEPPDIVNLSLSGPSDALLERILAKLIEQGVVVVAAVPNKESIGMSFPANMEGVICVATIGAIDTRSTTPPIFAPGDGILVAVPSNEYEFRSGTSLATAHVSGIVALLKARAPDIESQEIRKILLQSQAPNSSGIVAVNACRAMRFAEASMSCD